MKSHPSKRYPIFAAFADYYAITVTVLFIVNLIGVVTGQNPMTEAGAGVLLIFTILWVVIYYAFLGAKLSYLMPGERLIGGEIKDGKKHWVNPYGQSRGWLFFFMFFSLLLIGADWGSAHTTVLLPGVFIGKSIRFFGVYYALIAMGAGKIKWAILPGVLFLLSALLASMFYWATQIDTFVLLGILNGIAGVLALYVMKRYMAKK